jgi:hypothetical protein
MTDRPTDPPRQRRPSQPVVIVDRVSRPSPRVTPIVDARDLEIARANGCHVCPTCGDWLPLSVVAWRCGGPGRHLSPAPEVAAAEAAARAERVIMVLCAGAVFVFGLVVLALVLSGHL